MATAFAFRPQPQQPQFSANEPQLIRYLSGLWEEGAAARDESILRRADDNLRFQRGQQWPANLPRGMVDFVLNLVDDVVQRKAALLTDSRPELQVVSTNEQVRGRPDVLESLKTVLQAVWDQLSWSEELARGLGFAEVVGSNVGMMTWDPTAENGRGEIRPRFFDPRAFVLDPQVTAALDLQEGEFCGTEEIRSKASLIEQFGARAWYCRPDGDLSSYPSSRTPMRGVVSPAAGEQFRQHPRRRIQSQIPRVKNRNYWFKDWARDRTGRPIYYHDGRPAPRLIRHVVIAGGVVLADEPNPYWHGEYPYEMFDWGLELENPWGQSEVAKLRRAQEALNKLTSQVIKNTILMNNFKVIGDSNALDPEQWDRLTNRPALILRRRPGTTIDFESPPALPAYIFTVIEFLMKAIDLISGLGEISRGSADPSQSGIAIESLATAAQTLIRFQARRLEGFLTRLWRKAIPLVFQFYGSKRVIRLVGEGDRATTFLFDRAALFGGLVERDDIFRDFVLSITPGSSLAVAKIQKSVLAMNLFRAGLLPGVDVLRATEWKDPEETYKKAQQENMQRAQAMQAGGQTAGAGMARALGGGRRQLSQFPAGGPS